MVAEWLLTLSSRRTEQNDRKTSTKQMKSDPLRDLIVNKRFWAEPLSSEALHKGFKGWYQSQRLPHFDAPGKRQFITYRLADAMPLERRAEWAPLLEIEDECERCERIETYLDNGFGSCHLRIRMIADLVQQNLWHHDGLRYELLAWVIMPNHVHLLMDFASVPMGKVLQTLKTFTSRRANHILQRSGRFWQEDYFDRYIRNEAHFREVVRYIEGNPVKARLVRSPAEWPWSSAAFRGKPGPIVPELTHPRGRQQ